MSLNKKMTIKRIINIFLLLNDGPNKGKIAMRAMPYSPTRCILQPFATDRVRGEENEKNYQAVDRILKEKLGYDPGPRRSNRFKLSSRQKKFCKIECEEIRTYYYIGTILQEEIEMIRPKREFVFISSRSAWGLKTTEEFAEKDEGGMVTYPNHKTALIYLNQMKEILYFYR